VTIFLAPLTPKSGGTARGDGKGGSETGNPGVDNARATGVHITLPAPPDKDETWSLRLPGGRPVCTLPCDAWAGPVSGMYLQREGRAGIKSATVPFPDAFPHPVGSEVTAEYQAERGNPELAKWTWWLGGLWFGLMGAGFTIWGVTEYATCGSTDKGFCDMRGFVLGYGLFALGAGVASYWWYTWSHEKKFNTYEKLPPSKTGVRLGPGFVTGVF